jgi:hypothetical protein
VRGLIAISVFVVLSAAFAVESMSPRVFDASPSRAEVFEVGDDYTLLASKVDQGRAKSVYLGLAIRAATGTRTAEVIAPPGLEDMSVGTDASADAEIRPLNLRTVWNLAGGEFRNLDYDPRLTSGEMTGIRAAGSVESHPGGVVVVTSRDENVTANDSVVIHVDAEESSFVIVPYSLSPLGDKGEGQ